MYFFTADEHLGHANIIKFCNRPYSNVDEMDEDIIRRHNEIVTKHDITVHVGDFCWLSKKDEIAKKYIRRLNGNHIFLYGSHDHWLKGKASYFIWDKVIEGQRVIACHYAMRVWPVSHYGSWMVYGHSHGRLAPIGKSWDVGVDNNNFYPVSFIKLKEIMATREDNIDLVRS